MDWSWSPDHRDRVAPPLSDITCAINSVLLLFVVYTMTLIFCYYYAMQSEFSQWGATATHCDVAADGRFCEDAERQTWLGRDYADCRPSTLQYWNTVSSALNLTVTLTSRSLLASSTLSCSCRRSSGRLSAARHAVHQWDLWSTTSTIQMRECSNQFYF